jgi:hypothetical protein
VAGFSVAVPLKVALAEGTLRPIARSFWMVTGTTMSGADWLHATLEAALLRTA